MSSQPQPVLIAGQWRAAESSRNFQAANPATGELLDRSFPRSTWADVDAALTAAATAFDAMLDLSPRDIAQFLRQYADLVDARAETIAQVAADETGLPYEPRLKAVELPRTTGQLRQAADACEDGGWRMPVVDQANNIRSVLEPVGPVLVFGPNNFPLAFNGISGGDFAAAIAAGNPVIAKGHPAHPYTTQLLAEAAQEAACDLLPPGAVQLIYALDHTDGLRAVADPRMGAVAFTGSRTGGTAIKQACDAVGKPVYLEMSSINPVVLLPQSLQQHFDDIADQIATSALMGAGQFCTNPGLIVAVEGEATTRLITLLAERYQAAASGTLLTAGVAEGLAEATQQLQAAGATLVAGGSRQPGGRCAFDNTLLTVGGSHFLANAEALQTEAFGNATLMVTASNLDEVCQILQSLEGNLTGCVYSAVDGSDDQAYDRVARILRQKVGRLLNDKMPTGVAVSPAMNHGGPFPATGHPHFTAVGIPAALRRFTRLTCYDNVRPHRLPEILRG